MSAAREQPLAGRYRLGPLLGRGPGTTIHVAFDVGSGRRIAVKLAQDDLAADGLRREYEALVALRHPHLPEVHQLGVDPAHGKAYLARELVLGEQVDAFAVDCRPEELLRILRQAARALGFLHGRGIVHGDVKPANVLVRRLPEGGVWTTLIDLGFALEVDGSPGRLFRGTPSYSPARLLQGLPRGAVDDVYALAKSFLELRAAEDWREQVGALLMRASAEDPDLRPRDARAFLSAFDRAAPDLGGDDYAEDPTAFVGRKAELAALEALVDDPAAGLVSVQGPAGIGKSALLRVLRTNLVAAGRQVLQVDHRAATQDLAEVLVRLLAYCPGVRPEERRVVFASLGRDPLGRRPLGSAPLSPRALSSAIGRFLTVIGRRGGVVVLLDEDRVEEETEDPTLVEVLRRVSGAAGIDGITFVLAGVRVPAAVLGRPRARTLHLAELVEVEAAALARSVLGARRLDGLLDESRLEHLCRELAQLGGGHPGLLEAITRGLPREVVVGGTLGEERFAAGFPTDFADAVDAQLGRLRPDALATLQVLALQDGAVDGAMLADLLDLSDSRRRAALDELCRPGLVAHEEVEASPADEMADRGPGRTGFQVSSRVIAIRARAMLGPGQAEAIHARTVEVFEGQRIGSCRVRDELALHALASGRRDLIVRHVPVSSRVLLERGLPARAARLASSALDRLGDRASATEAGRALGLTLADALFACGELQRALGVYEELSRSPLAPSDLVHVTRQQAECLATMGEFEEAERRLAAVTADVLDALAPREAALLAGTRARLAFRRGHADAATRILLRGLEQLQAGEDEAVAAELWNNLGVVAFDSGRFDEAEQWHRRAYEARQRLGDERGVSFSLGNLANVAFVRGQLGDAREGYLSSLRLKRRLGEPAAIATSLSNLGLVAGSMGRFAEALTRHEEALGLREEMGDGSGRARSLSALAELMSLKGHHRRALGFAREAVGAVSQTGVRDAGLAAALATLAEVSVTLGAFDEASVAVSRGLELCTEASLPNEAALFEARAAEVTLWRDLEDEHAFERLRAAVRKLREGGDRATLARVLSVKATLELERGLDLRAAQHGEELVRLGRECFSPTLTAEGHFVLGVTADRRGEATQAAEWLHEALREAERMGLPGLLLATQAALATFHEQRGRGERAGRWSLRCLESLRAELSELEGEEEELAFLAHPRRRRILALLSSRAGG